MRTTLRRFSSAKKFMRWLCRPERSFQLVVSQAHRADKGGPAWIGVEVGEERIDQQVVQARIALPTRAFQPLKRPVLLPAVGVDFRDLVGGRPGGPFD